MSEVSHDEVLGALIDEATAARQAGERDLPNLSMLVTVLDNFYGSRKRCSAMVGVSIDTLRLIENKASKDPKFSTALALVDAAVAAFGPEQARKYWEIV